MRGIHIARHLSGAFTPDQLGMLFWTLNIAANLTLVNVNVAQTANSLTKSGTNCFLTKSGAAFVNNDFSGQEITITGASNSANNGTFIITAITGTTLLWANASAVSESPFTGTWSTAGKCSQLTSSDSNHFAFAQATQLNRLVGCVSGFPGHTVLRKTAVQFMSIASVSAMAGQLNGDTTCTLGMYAKINSVGAGASFMRFDDTTANNRIEWSEGTLVTSGSVLARSAGGTTTTNTVAYTYDTTAAHLYTVVYTAGGTHEEFVDGVSQGTQSGTVRSPASMSQVFLSNNSAAGNWSVGGWFAKAGAISTANQVRLKNYYAAQLA